MLLTPEMMYPAPSNETANWNDPTEAEVEVTNGAFAAALGGAERLTPLQVMSIAAIGHSMTGYGFDLERLPSTGPEELAAALHDRSAAWRTRILHVMLIGALLLEEIPPDVQVRLEEYAGALGVHDDMLTLTANLASGSKGAAMADFQRSGYEGEWSQSAALQTDHVLGSAWAIVEDDPALARRWAELEGCPRGSLGRAVFNFYDARGFAYPGQPGSAPPLLAQHDWIHVLADFGSTVESEIEVFSFIATANEDPRAFSLQAMVLSLFETGNIGTGAGLFEASTGHLSAEGNAMAARMGDAMRRGFLCGTRGTGEDLLGVDWFSHADSPLEDVRRRFHVVPKRQDAWELGSVTAWERGGISPFQYEGGQGAAERAGREYVSYGASPPE
ncbi:MAG: hypothetical protein ACR2OH_00780 [Microthrixaceae bacterium]